MARTTGRRYRYYFLARVAVAGVPQAQTATISLPNGKTFTAPSTNSSNTADLPQLLLSPPTLQWNHVFAGLTDDPFFF